MRANEDTSRSRSPPMLPHEGSTKHHELQNFGYRGEDGELGTTHHALRCHHPIPVSVPVSSNPDPTFQGEIAGEKAKSSIIVRSVIEKRASLEEQEQCGTQGGSGDDYEEFPEGGLKAWSVVLGSFFALFSSLGIMNTIGMSELRRKRRGEE